MRRSRRGSGSGSPPIFGFAAVEIDPEIADRDFSALAQRAAADRADPGEDLADMDGLAQDVVDAGGEHAERVLERRALFQADDGSLGALADEAGKCSRPSQSPIRKASTASTSFSLALVIHSLNSIGSMPAVETPSRSNPEE